VCVHIAQSTHLPPSSERGLPAPAALLMLCARARTDMRTLMRPLILPASTAIDRRPRPTREEGEVARLKEGASRGNSRPGPEEEEDQSRPALHTGKKEGGEVGPAQAHR
jgi:hypothetical protein